MDKDTGALLSSIEGKFLIAERTVTRATKKESFSAFLTDLQKKNVVKYSDGLYADISEVETKCIVHTAALSARIGIKKGTFENMLYRKKPIKKRDCLIAICLALHFDTLDAQDVFRAYDPSIPSLDDGSDREYYIMSLLNNGKGLPTKPFDFEEINALLKDSAYDELRVIDQRNGYRMPESTATQRFSWSSDIIVRTTTDDYFTAERGLGIQYDINCYRCSATTYVGYADKPATYQLVATNDGTLFVTPLRDDPISNEPLKCYQSIEDSGIFKSYFVRLQGAALKQKKEMDQRLADTRNFGERFSANVLDGKLHIFAENLNYDVPLSNEYCLYEYKNGASTFSTSSESRFMKLYLGDADYQKHYGAKAQPVKSLYSSIEQVLEDVKKERSSISQHVGLRGRAKAFRRLYELTQACLSKLRSREMFVFDLDFISDEPYFVCSYFHVEEAFDCELIHNDFAEMLIAHKDAAEFVAKSGATITLSIAELQRAFELGVHTIEEICQIKDSLGSIDAILPEIT